MSWLSQTIKSGKLGKVTVGKAIRAIPLVGDAIVNEAESHKIESSVASAQHLAKEGYEMVQRYARENNVSELEALSILARRADAHFTGWRYITENQGWLLPLLLAVALFLIVRKGR